MTLYKMVGGVNVPFTTEEESDRAARDLTWFDNAPVRAWERLRNTRDSLIPDVDHKINTIEDASGDTSAWRTYRQALRDLPDNTQDPANVTWPTPPA